MSKQDSVFLSANQSLSKLSDMASVASPLGWAKVGMSEKFGTQTEGKKTMQDIEALLSEVRRGSSLKVGQFGGGEGEVDPDNQTGGKKKKSGSKAKKSGSKAKKSGSKGKKQKGGSASSAGSDASQTGGKKKKSGSKAKKSGSKGKKSGSKGKKQKGGSASDASQTGGKKKRSGSKAKKSGSKGKKQKGGSASSAGSDASQAGGKKKRSGSKAKKSGSKQKGGDEKPKRKMPQAILDIQTVKKAIVAEIPELKPDIPMTSVANTFLKKHGSVKDAVANIKSNKSELKKMHEKEKKRIEEKKAKTKADKAKAAMSSSGSE